LWIFHAYQYSTVKQPFKMQHLKGKHVWECGKCGIKDNDGNRQCDILTYISTHI
jgi:hypothetical protein